MQLVFIVCQGEDNRSILKLSCRPFAFTSNKTFWKTKRSLETSLSTSFSAGYSKKNIHIVVIYYLTNFHCLVAFTCFFMYCNCLLTRLWRHKFWKQHYFSDQAISPTWQQKVKTKTQISWEQKELLRWNKKHFSSF